MPFHGLAKAAGASATRAASVSAFRMEVPGEVNHVVRRGDSGWPASSVLAARRGRMLVTYWMRGGRRSFLWVAVLMGALAWAAGAAELAGTEFVGPESCKACHPD